MTLRGNSLAREFEVEGVEVRARGGATLREMLEDARGDRGTTVFLFGIPDLFERGSLVIRRGAKDRLLEAIRSVRGKKELCWQRFFFRR